MLFLHDMEKFIIIVAGGSGTRMGTTLPKQFLDINKKPVLMHTLEVFHRFDPKSKIILGLPEPQMDFWQQLCAQHNFKIEHQLSPGGETRFHTVKNALNLVDGEGLVAVHDGVRPLVSTDTLERCFDGAESDGATIPVLPVVESVRQLTNSGSIAVDRSQYVSVQTPQVFQSKIIKDAYEQDFSNHFTDDASVVEALGHSIHLVDGNRENIKITHPMDLKMAELLIENG